MTDPHVIAKEGPSPEAQLLRFMREAKGLSQLELAEARGVSEATISHLETGRRPFRKVTLASLAAVMGFGDSDVAKFRRKLEELNLARREWQLADIDLTTASLARRCAAAYGLRAARSFEAILDGTFSRDEVRLERWEAQRAFQRLVRLPATERRFLVETHPAYQTIGMVEQLCLASVGAAAKDPKISLFLSQLALACADRIPVPPRDRARLQGYAWAFVGNAQRVGVGLREASQAFVQSDRLWATGKGFESEFLEEWRLPDLKASLRRDQRLWKETLALSAGALAMAPAFARGRILVNKAFALGQMGEPERALQTLGEAAPLIEASGDPNELLVLRMNLAVNLTDVGRLEEAGREVGAARTLALELGKDLHVLRCLWISGRIAGESGCWAEAVAALAQARRDFTARELPLEAADVAMDEAIYLLQDGDSQRVADLTDEVAWVFTIEGLAEDALKILKLFCEAAHQQGATIELARQVRDRLRSAA